MQTVESSQRATPRIAGRAMAVFSLCLLALSGLACGFGSSAANIQIEPTAPIPTDVEQLALAGVTTNNQWAVYAQTYANSEMLLVPAGCFMMGSEDGRPAETPVHEVCFESPYWIDAYEVTNQEYADFLSANGNQEVPGEVWTWFNDGNEDWALITGRGRNWSPKPGFEQHPVLSVNWWGSVAYCEWQGKRLPTEAEWEYAARGPDNLIYPWGNAFDNTAVNFCDSNCRSDFYADQTADDGYEQTAPVGSYPNGRSWIGAFDMSGNMGEWVADAYDPDYYAQSPTVNPQGPPGTHERVVRGGNWRDTAEQNLQMFERTQQTPDGFAADFTEGFRCARSY